MTTDARDPRELDEDGFHEIQLSGKQLVFLCMATTVVSIVIFLCGVLVGRGVRPVEPVAEAAAATSTEPAAEPSAPPAAEPSAPAAPANAPAASASARTAPPAESIPPPAPDAPPATEREPAKPSNRASAPAAVAANNAPANTAAAATKKPEAPKPSEPAKPEVAAAARPAPAPSQPVADAPATPVAERAVPAAAPAASSSNSSGNGSSGAIAVQVGAMKEKGDAEALARHLSGKGYAVYIVQPAGNAPNPVYRVRVGNYTSPDEAARVKRRLEQEEKLKPWITR